MASPLLRSGIAPSPGEKYLIRGITPHTLNRIRRVKGFNSRGYRGETVFGLIRNRELRPARVDRAYLFGV